MGLTNLPANSPPGEAFGCPTDAEGAAGGGLRFRQLLRDSQADSRVPCTGYRAGSHSPSGSVSLPFLRTAMQPPGARPSCRGAGRAGGGRLAGGARSPGSPSGLRRAGAPGRKVEGAGEERRRGTWVREVTALVFLPAKSSSPTDIHGRDERWFQFLLVLKEKKEKRRPALLQT